MAFRCRWMGAGRAVGLIACAVSIASISESRAGSGNLGKTRTICCSTVTVTVGANTYSQTIDPNDTTTTLRNRLVTQIGDPSTPYWAGTFTDPDDPNAIAFQVLTKSLAEIPAMKICEDGHRIEDVGVIFPSARGAMFRKVTAVDGLNSDPNVHAGRPYYTLTVRSVPYMGPDPLYVWTYYTDAPPDNTPSGLNNHIKSDLQAAGFSVADDGASFSISKAGEGIAVLKTSTTDSGITDFCVFATNGPMLIPSTQIPTLSETGMLALVLMLAGAALLVLWKKRAAPRGSAP